jgi:riboflavin kinase/FMN adenylyltransferase
MQTFSKRLSPLENQVALVLGNFDGFHKGHMTLLEEAKRISVEAGIQSAVFSFEPHPSFVLSHKEPVDLINTRREKEMVFELLGMDFYFEFPFTMELAALDPESFIKELLLKQVNPHTIVVGEDYHFGKKRQGNVDMLRVLGEKYNFKVSVLPKMMDEEKEISSTWIRQLIKEGNIEKANFLIGRPFFITGMVRDGAKIGRTIGYPTANLTPDKEKLLPPFGVYVTKVTFDKREFYGMTNVGDRPTVETEGVIVESFMV